MDKFITHLQPLPRLYPHPTPIATIGYIPHKVAFIDTAFDTLNFSIILSGQGEYRFRGRSWDVQAPAVIMQWPGERVAYGPTPVWEELYLIYHPEILPGLRANRTARESRPVWHIAQDTRLKQQVGDLINLLADVRTAGRADEIDRLCELMIVESLLGRARPRPAGPTGNIQRIRHYVHEHLNEPIDFETLAGFHGMSSPTFRRHWAKQVAMPPGQYQTHLRIQEACRMLAETVLPIGQIAQAVGYEDVLYFSRRFRQVMNMTASQYRQANRSVGTEEEQSAP